MAHRRRVVGRDGKIIPSVTTVLGKFKDPGALMYWSWNTAYSVLEEAIQLMKKPPSDTATREKSKFLRTKPLDRGHYRKQSGAAADAGTLAHDLVEQYIHATRGEKTNMHKLTAAKVRTVHNTTKQIAEHAYTAFENFLEWNTVTKFRPQFTETHLISTDERQFHGSIDCVGKINNELVLLDWKTSKALYGDYLMQIAAYGSLWKMNNPKKPLTSFHLIRFNKEDADFHHHRFDELDEAAECFVLFRHAYDLVKGIEKRAK